MLKYFHNYINSFKGFSKEIWILATITFINRAGTMVLPFLSKYLREDLGFTLSQVGWIMVCFGLGSMLGSYIGGKLTDKIGFYNVMIFSLLTSGFLFIALQFITSFVGLCISIFILMTIADMFRPAMYVSLGTYAKPKDRVRAFTLVRLCINLGFAAGPALGGLVIMNMGYSFLFWFDGLSSIIAILTFLYFIKAKKTDVVKTNIDNLIINNKSVFYDSPFLLFIAGSFCLAAVFFQLFVTFPLYHQDFYKLTEFQTGLFMTVNGLLIFLFEMPLVNHIEKKGYDKVKVVLVGTILFAISFYILIFQNFIGILWISIVFLTFGQMLSFPFSNAIAVSISPINQQGKYMGIFTMSFSLGHIVSSKLGTFVIDNYGYVTNWLVMGSIAVIGILLFYSMNNIISKTEN